MQIWRNRSRRWASAAVAVAIIVSAASCATVPDLPPPERTKSFDLSKDEAWARLIEFFAASNIPIRTIEKDSGVVYAERMNASAEEFLGSSWGRCSGAMFAGDRVTISTTVNVFMRESGPGRTTATVNVTHTLSYAAFLSGVARVERCESTGYLEALILDVIGGTKTAVKPIGWKQLVR